MSIGRFLCVLLLAACWTMPAFAQINPFRGTKGKQLNAEDLAALTEATNRLLDRPELQAGGSEGWTNPKSGASGTVTAGQASHRKGLACRAVVYRHMVSAAGAERTASLTWCRTKEGWKIG